MAVIAPTLLAENPDNYKEQAQRLLPFAERVHIDLSDGEFSPTFTVTEVQVWWPEQWTVDIHAMVAHPSDHADALIALKPQLIIFHAEVKEDLLPTLQKVKQAGIKAGIALMRPTVPNTVASYIEAADHVMIFSGDLGHYGGTASMMQVEKIRLIKKINPDVEIGWDGGVAIDNTFSLSHGGVDVLNVGGAIAKNADPAAAYTALVNEVNKHGVI